MAVSQDGEIAVSGLTPIIARLARHVVQLLRPAVDLADLVDLVQ